MVPPSGPSRLFSWTAPRFSHPILRGLRARPVLCPKKFVITRVATGASMGIPPPRRSRPYRTGALSHVIGSIIAAVREDDVPLDGCATRCGSLLFSLLRNGVGGTLVFLRLTKEKGGGGCEGSFCCWLG